MVCLDTSFLIDLLRGNAAVKDLKAMLEKTESRITIAAPSAVELWGGACLAKNSDKAKAKVGELLMAFPILPLDLNGAQEAGEIEATLIKSGQMIEPEDLMIAGIALAHGETIVTKDAHFTRVPGLRVLKY
jgi:predicted nucleic acid-binding protein